MVHHLQNESVELFKKRMEVISLIDPGFWTRFGVHCKMSNTCKSMVSVSADVYLNTFRWSVYRCLAEQCISRTVLVLAREGCALADWHGRLLCHDRTRPRLQRPWS